MENQDFLPQNYTRKEQFSKTYSCRVNSTRNIGCQVLRMSRDLVCQSRLRPPQPVMCNERILIFFFWNRMLNCFTLKRTATTVKIWKDVPTYAKKRQYRAAIIGAGIEAKTAPNFPGKPSMRSVSTFSWQWVAERVG